MPHLSSEIVLKQSTIDIFDRRIVNVQDAQLSQRDRAAGCVIVFAKSRRLELGDNILQTL